MWLDESLNSFFRRLCFTPDGSFLIAPSQPNTNIFPLILFIYSYHSFSSLVQVRGQKLEKRPKTPPTSLLEVILPSMCILSQTINFVHTHAHTHTHNNKYILFFPLQTSTSAPWPREANCMCAMLPRLI